MQCKNAGISCYLPRHYSVLDFLFVCGLFFPQNISPIHPSQMGYIHQGTLETANKLAIIFLQLEIIKTLPYSDKIRL
jgi:hypothetical protein